LFNTPSALHARYKCPFTWIFKDRQEPQGRTRRNYRDAFFTASRKLATHFAENYEFSAHNSN
jgi:hypothetical protein